jgi:hypothetical protein
MGPAQAFTWIVLDVECAILWLKPDPTDLNDVKNAIMNEVTYTLY